MLRRCLMRQVVVLLTLWFVTLGWQLPVAAAGPETNAACRAVRWIRAQQLPDGGFGQRNADGSYQSSASVTADVVYTLALLGEDPGGPKWTVAGGRSALEALAALTPSYVSGGDAGQTGKVARAVALAGADPRAFAGLDLTAIIEAAYDTATGRYSRDYLYRHTLAVEGLLRSGRTVPAAAYGALLEAQLPDGGWFWSFNAEADTRSDVDSTGRVLALLAGLARLRDDAAFRRAAEYLAATQLGAGGWNVGYLPGPSNANSTALAAGGLAAVGLDLRAGPLWRNGRTVVETLLSFQEPTGAFVYRQVRGQEEVRLMATLDALSFLAWQSRRPPCAASHRWSLRAE